MGDRPSFADWQLSRGIVPWVAVHNFSEYAWREWELKVRMTRVFRVLAEPMVAAFRQLADACAAAAESVDAFVGRWST